MCTQFDQHIFGLHATRTHRFCQSDYERTIFLNGRIIFECQEIPSPRSSEFVLQMNIL